MSRFNAFESNIFIRSFGSLIHASSDKHIILTVPACYTTEMQAFKHPKRGAEIMNDLLFLPVNVRGVFKGGNLEYTKETFLDRSSEIILVIKAGNNPVSLDNRCIPCASYTLSEAVSLSIFIFLISLSISVFRSK